MKYISPPKKASFEIIGTNVADIGARLTLTDRLIREGVEWGSVENIGNKKIVLKLGGTKEEIEGYRKLIKEKFGAWMVEDIDEEERIRKKIANPGIHYTALTYDDSLLVLPIDKHAHAIECQQLRKGVNVFENIHGTLKELSQINEKLIETIENLNKK